jgi:flagellin
LIVSEGLRAEKAALGVAIENARRAESVVSVAEGSLQEVSALLLELEDLVDRSANDAAVSADQVKANQLQIDSVLQSINRIADTATFDGKKLLNGDLAFTTSSVNSTQISDVRVNAAKIPNNGYRTVVLDVVASSQSARLDRTGAALANNVTLQVRGNFGTEILSFASGTQQSAIAFAVNSVTQLTGVSATIAGSTVSFSSTGFGSDAFVSVETLQGTFTVTGGSDGTLDHGVDGTVLINGAQAIVRGLDASVRSGSLSLDVTLDASFAQQTTTNATFQITGGGAVFSISPDVGLAGQETIGITSVSTATLGNRTDGFLSSLGSGQANDLSSKNFAVAQRVVRAAQDQISQLRGRIGAFQKDTLATSVNSLLVTLENTTAAESAIRDADFAAETSALTRAQILVNSSTITLRTANQVPSNVLSLLQ